ELRVPDRGEVAVRDEGPRQAVEERAGVRVEEGPVVVERAVLDRDGDLVVRLVGGECVALLRRGPGQDRGRAGASVDDGRVPGWATADQEEPGRPGVDVEPGHAEGVVVVPGGRGPLDVGVLEGRVARSPRRAELGFGLRCEEVVPGPDVRVSGRYVVRGGEVP